MASISRVLLGKKVLYSMDNINKTTKKLLRKLSPFRPTYTSIYFYHHLGMVRGSDPIPRDVLKIIKLFAQNLRRHFFVRERGMTHCVLLMSLGATNRPLLFEIMFDYITIFCFEVL